MAIGPSGITSTSTRSPPSLGQQQCLDYIMRCTEAAGKPPDDLDGPGAFRELWARRGHNGESCTAAPFDVSQLALSEKGHRPASLTSLRGAAGAEPAKGPVDRVLPNEEAERRKAATRAKRPFNNPRLRSRRVHRDLTSKLNDS
eukprot:4256214-Pyramimonas_sp.AAC.1